MPIVSIPRECPPDKKCWARQITALDESKQGGYMYIGQHLWVGQLVDIPSGGIVVHSWESGDKFETGFVVYRVAIDGTLEEHLRLHGRLCPKRAIPTVRRLLTGDSQEIEELKQALSKIFDTIHNKPHLMPVIQSAFRCEGLDIVVK